MASCSWVYDPTRINENEYGGLASVDQGRLSLWYCESAAEFDSRAYVGNPHCCFEHANRISLGKYAPARDAKEAERAEARRCCGRCAQGQLERMYRLHGKAARSAKRFGPSHNYRRRLLALHDWLKEHQVTEVGWRRPGSTGRGVLRTERAFRVILSIRQRFKRMRRAQDRCQRLRLVSFQLLDHGIVRPSLSRRGEIRELRDLVRYRV